MDLPDHDESGLPTDAGLKPSRAVGGSLNALVRATALYRKGVQRYAATAEGGASETQRAVAERAAKVWRRAQLAPLQIEATRVLVDGHEALRADNEHTQWVLYAFMAGVRRITPRRAMTANDVVRLVQALVSLEPSVQSIEHFRDWLDADGAEGFEIRVHTSFREVFEEIDLEEEREFSKAFTMARFEVPRSGDAVYIAARDLDIVAMRREFEMPIEMYTSGAVSQAVGGLSDDDLLAIGARCDDANAWASAEIEAVLALPELRTAITPEQMARRVVTRLTAEADERFLMLLAKLNVKDDPFRQAVARALGTSEVGEIVARQLQLDSDTAVEALGRFLVLSPAELTQAVVLSLLDRASDDALALDAVGSLSQWYGAAQVCGWVHAPSLTVDQAQALGSALGRGAIAPAELTRLVLAAPMQASLTLLATLPRETLAALGHGLHVLWGRVKPDSVEPLAELMAAGGSSENLKTLGDLLLSGKADGWHVRTLYALCAGLVAHGFGRSHVLTLALRRGANEQARLVAIDCLQRDAQLAKEACRFSVTRFFESSTIRERLRKLSEQTAVRGASA